jgi:DNA repair photolyase
MELGWDEFESRIFVKTGADRVLLKTLDHRTLRGRPIIIGTATDPYQPAEVKYGLTRKLLEVFGEAQGLSISINTKSSLAKRDVSLFRRVAARNDLRVNISLISMDERLLRGLEPRASSPKARLEALRQISAAGIPSGLFMMPIIPGLTDSLNTLESVVREALQHGAQYLCSSILFLRKSSQLIFHTYLQDNHPELCYRYQELFAGRREVSQSYRRVVQTRVNALKEKYGFPETLPDRWRAPVEPSSVQLQLEGVA